MSWRNISFEKWRIKFYFNLKHWPKFKVTGKTVGCFQILFLLFHQMCTMLEELKPHMEQTSRQNNVFSYESENQRRQQSHFDT